MFLVVVLAVILGSALGIGLFFVLWRRLRMLTRIVSWAVMGTVFCVFLVFGGNWLLGGIGVVIGVMIAGAGLSATIGEQLGAGKPNKRQLTIRGAIIGLVSGFFIGLAVMYVLGSLWALLIIALYSGNLAVFSGLYDEAQPIKGGIRRGHS